MRTLVRLGSLAVLVALAVAGCSKGGGAAATDGASDVSGDRPVVLCSDVDEGPANPGAGAVTTTDEFGPNAPAARIASAIGRVNIYEIASPGLLERVDVYLRANLEQTRLTIAVQEANSRTSAFRKLTDIQIDVETCQGWATSGPLAIPLESGRYYSIGFDPNQPITAFVSADTDALPIDGAFGRLIGSKAATSVSVPTITWDKFSDKEYNRQRLLTSSRPDASAPAAEPADASTDGG